MRKIEIFVKLPSVPAIVVLECLCDAQTLVRSIERMGHEAVVVNRDLVIVSERPKNA